jgi:hypothetical protein
LIFIILKKIQEHLNEVLDLEGKNQDEKAKRNKFIIYKKNYFNNYHYFKRRKPKKSYRIIRRGRFRFKLPIFPRKPRTYRIARRPRRKKRKNYRRVCI